MDTFSDWSRFDMEAFGAGDGVVGTFFAVSFFVEDSGGADE